MIAIIDYGVGNLFSLRCSLEAVGAEVCVSREPSVLAGADKLILPGVGAFEDAVRLLWERGLFEPLRAMALGGKPLLGICLGMQLLFERSYEFGVHEGLGLISGEVRALREWLPKELPVPHMGWNALHFPQDKARHTLFDGLESDSHVYFVHSYAACGCGDALIAACEYGGAAVTAAVARDRIYGVQFHPEKSGRNGLGILAAFVQRG